jgi:hypothetical protein
MGVIIRHHPQDAPHPLTLKQSLCPGREKLTKVCVFAPPSTPILTFPLSGGRNSSGDHRHAYEQTPPFLPLPPLLICLLYLEGPFAFQKHPG